MKVMKYRLEQKDVLKHRLDMRRWRVSNPKRHNEKQLSYYHRIRFRALALLGNKCSICGFSDIRALQVDHVNGGGRQEIKNSTAPSVYWNSVLRKIEAGSKDYRCLCANCNWIERNIHGQNGGRHAS